MLRKEYKFERSLCTYFDARKSCFRRISTELQRELDEIAITGNTWPQKKGVCRQLFPGDETVFRQSRPRFDYTKKCRLLCANIRKQRQRTELFNSVRATSSLNPGQKPKIMSQFFHQDSTNVSGEVQQKLPIRSDYSNYDSILYQYVNGQRGRPTCRELYDVFYFWKSQDGERKYEFTPLDIDYRKIEAKYNSSDVRNCCAEEFGSKNGEQLCLHGAVFDWAVDEILSLVPQRRRFLHDIIRYNDAKDLDRIYKQLTAPIRNAKTTIRIIVDHPKDGWNHLHVVHGCNWTAATLLHLS